MRQLRLITLAVFLQNEDTGKIINQLIYAKKQLIINICKVKGL